MVKAYLRYAKGASFGVISSNSSNAVYDRSGKFVLAPALEDVIIWHVKQGVQVARWHDFEDGKKSPEVTCIVPCSPGNASKLSGDDDDEEFYAVGYADGSVRIWSLKTNACRITFNGHKNAVTALRFSRNNAWLISGSKDSDLIVWDCVAETGLYRLRGHKDQITSLEFVYADQQQQQQPTHILSASKDTLIKAWDLSTQHCVETLIGHRSEVWSMALTNDQKFLITGTSDMELKVWRLDLETLQQKISGEIPAAESSGGSITEPEAQKLALTFYGALNKTSKERVVQLSIHPSQKFFACQTNDRSVELFKIRTESEMKRKLNKKKRKRDEKKGDGEPVDSEPVEPKASDQFISHRVIRAGAKVRSFDFKPTSKDDSSIVFMCALANNSIEVYDVQIESPEASVLSTLDIPGHRSDIRAMALSSDDEMLMSAGNASIKIWNTRTYQCMRTLPLPDAYIVCCAWIPGNRYVVAGTKTGQALLFDSWSSTLLETIQAHQGALWSIDVRPDKKGLATAGADKEVKFWDFGALLDPEFSETAKRLTMTHSRTLQLTDEVLCVKYSPDQKLIAVSLLDSTVKVFYEDSLKFFLNIYGHKLPVLSMDISSDSTLLLTGSADKNVKLWGLDFGDCHKSIFAHTDSVMQVKFVPQTHYFFTCSKDKTIKYWDGDRFEQIMKLEGHHGELWALCVGRWGNIVASAGHDKGIRIWQKTDEQLFLEEEREREVEEEFVQDLVDNQQSLENDTGEVGAAGKKTADTLKAGERIMDAINIMDEEAEKWRAYQESLAKDSQTVAPETNPILKAFGDIKPELHLLRTIEKVRSSDLDEALLVLSYGNILSLLQAIDVWAKNEWNIGLTCRILVFILNSYLNSLTANRSVQIQTTGDNATAKNVSIRPIIESIKKHLHAAIAKQKDQIGFNLAGMKVIKSLWEQEHTSEFMDWEKQLQTQVSSIKSQKNDGKQGAKRNNKKKQKTMIVKMTADAVA